MSKLLTTSTLLLFAAGAVAQPKAPVPDSYSVRTLSFAPDGSRLAASVVTPGGGGVVIVWDVASRKRLATSEKTGDLPNVVFAPDGKAVALADGKPVIALLDPASGKKTGEIGPFPSDISAIAAGANGQWVALGKDHVFRVWDEAIKKITNEVGIGKAPYGWAISPDGAWLFTGGDAGDKLWNLKTGAAVEGFPPRTGASSRGVFMTANRLLIGTNYGTNRVVEVPSGTELIRFKNEGGTYDLAYSAAAEMMAGRYYTSRGAALTPLLLRQPNATEKERVAALLKECDSDDYPTREKAAAALVKAGAGAEPLLRQAMVDGPSAEVRMRARVAREEILNKPTIRLTGHTDDVRPMTFSPDGKLFATGGADGLVILWDPAAGKELARMSVKPD